jgi:hypothetical protein
MKRWWTPKDYKFPTTFRSSDKYSSSRPASLFRSYFRPLWLYLKRLHLPQDAALPLYQV